MKSKKLVRKFYSPAKIAQINKVIANNLTTARENAGMTQQEVAIHLYGKKTQKARISEIESGRKTIDFYKFLQLVELYGQSADYILGRSTEPIMDIYANHINYVQLCAKRYFDPIIEQMTEGLIDYIVKVDKDTHYQLVECAKAVSNEAIKDQSLKYNNPKLYQSLLQMTNLVRKIEVAHAKKMMQINTQLSIIAEQDPKHLRFDTTTQYSLPLPELDMELANE